MQTHFRLVVLYQGVSDVVVARRQVEKLTWAIYGLIQVVSDQHGTEVCAITSSSNSDDKDLNVPS